MTKLFHQLGFRYQWNLQSIETNNTGEGVIIAPRHMSKEKVMSLPLSLREVSIFDPQYYVPSSSRGELSTYDFFPQVVADGFQTSEWTTEMAFQSAFGCLSFQMECSFQYLVAPTRFRDGMPSDYIESQTSFFVEPFLQAHRDLGRKKPLILQIILTDQMLKDRPYAVDVLNWVTGIEQLDGVYLIYKFDRTHKQIDDIEFLLSVDFFVKSLKRSGMIVVLGYMNTESIPLMCAEPDIMTFGSYENLRKFSTLSFEEPSDKKQQSPNARIYIARLLQWVDHNYMGSIARAVKDLEEFVGDNEYRVTMFQPTFKWHSSNPVLYKHYFLSFSNQFNRLSAFTGSERVQSLKEECRNALKQYEILENKGIVFDSDSSGRHLASWLTFLNQR